MPTTNKNERAAGPSCLSRKLFSWISAGLAALTSTVTTAYDNSRFPHFETAKAGRGFQNISIHPNGDEWLITECSDAITSQAQCYLMVYSKRNHTYRRFNLPLSHSYIDGNYSPSGKQILMIRQPVMKNNGHVDVMKSFANGEIAIMNSDGSNFRVLPIPANRIISPSMSPDEKKISYLIAETDQPPARGVNFSYFDIWEFDLSTGENKLFAGPLRFFHATTISYLSDSEILAGALAPLNTGSNELRDYLNRFKGSEIYRVRRAIRFGPEPIFYDLPFAKFPTSDGLGNIYYETQPQKIGFALTRRDISGATTIWREPHMQLCNVSQIVAARSGSYIGFLYGGDAIESKSGRNALGYFDIERETWNPLTPPLITESQLIPVIANQ